MQRKQPIYENGVAYWQCGKCKKWLPEFEYYLDKRTGNHLKSQCKKCHYDTINKTRDRDNKRTWNREYMRRARETDPNKFRIRRRLQGNPLSNKTTARQILDNAVRAGKVIRPTNCSKCGKIQKITAHHDDYSKPLQVRWLCLECHGKQTVIDNGIGF